MEGEGRLHPSHSNSTKHNAKAATEGTLYAQQKCELWGVHLQKAQSTFDEKDLSQGLSDVTYVMRGEWCGGCIHAAHL